MQLTYGPDFALFDPDDPARYQIFADLSSEYALSSHWAIRSSIAVNVDHNFDESNRQQSDSVLPKVRSDVVRYLNQGDSGLEKLIVEGRDTVGRSIHYRVFGGILRRCTRERGRGAVLASISPVSHLVLVLRMQSNVTLIGAWGCSTIRSSPDTCPRTGRPRFIIMTSRSTQVGTLPRMLARPLRRGERSVTVGKWACGQR